MNALSDEMPFRDDPVRHAEWDYQNAMCTRELRDAVVHQAERVALLETLIAALAPHCRYVDRKEAEAFKERISRALPQNQEGR